MTRDEISDSVSTKPLFETILQTTPQNRDEQLLERHLVATTGTAPQSPQPCPIRSSSAVRRGPDCDGRFEKDATPQDRPADPGTAAVWCSTAVKVVPGGMETLQIQMWSE